MNANRTNLILPPLEDGVVVEGGDSVAVVEPGADLHVHHLSHVVRVTHTRCILHSQIYNTIIVRFLLNGNWNH